MAANAPPKPKLPPETSKETWEHWLPPDGRDEGLLEAEPLLTRDELVEELRSVGHDVSARDLVYWQTRGVIPYPVRQKRHGRSVAVYPRWMINLIHRLKNLQEEGRVLREIGPLLRGIVFHMFAPYPQTPEQMTRQIQRQARRALYPLVSELEPRIRSFARIHEQLRDDHIVGAEIHLIRENGTRTIYSFPTGDTNDPSDPIDGEKR